MASAVRASGQALPANDNMAPSSQTQHLHPTRMTVSKVLGHHPNDRPRESSVMEQTALWKS